MRVGNPHGLEGLKKTETSVSTQLMIFFKDTFWTATGIPSASKQILLIKKALHTLDT